MDARTRDIAISDALERILPWVEKPARYTGGEWNSVTKPWDSTPTRVALAFPDIYEIGMSNLGLTILYDILNREQGILAERVFAPWVDMERAMRLEDVPLFSLESRRPLGDFDIIGFSLPYEQLYTNALNMLNLSRIPLRSCDRGPGDPLVIAGGGAAYNPEPVHAFFDAFVLGDGEEAILEVVHTYERWRHDAGRSDPLNGRDESQALDAHSGKGSRSTLLTDLARLGGVYVPSLYEVSYREDGTVADIEAAAVEAQLPIVKRIVSRLPAPPTRLVVPFLDVVHNRAVVEIQRGCTRGCRFCHAGMTYRPLRERPVDEVLSAVGELVDNTGFDEVALLSLSASDYSGIGELVEGVLGIPGAQGLSVGLPSLRIDSFSVDLLDQLARSRRRGGFTFAPEAATDRLRQVINKPIATEDMLQVAEQVFARGWTTLKLYFMIGHPTQTQEDVAAIVRLARQVRQIGRQHAGGRANVRVSVSTFEPKPHTPFQWQPLAEEADISAQLSLLRRGLQQRGLHLSWNDPKETLIAAALSRGDRRLADVVQRAWELGARFDSWQDQFSFETWVAAFTEAGLEPDWYARRFRPLTERLPWDHLQTGVTRQFLVDEHENALRGEATTYCREQCHSCGILRQFQHERDGAEWGCPAPGRTQPPVGPARAAEPSAPKEPPPPGRAATHRVRLSFGSGEPVKYISHLDSMRLWEKALRRAGLPLAYTQGFHPQPRIQFAAPLAVGFTGESETLDLWLTKQVNPNEFAERVAAQLPRGVELQRAQEVDISEPSLPARVRGAVYSVAVADDATPTQLAARVAALMEQPEIHRQRRRKGRMRDYDLRPLIDQLRYDGVAPEDGKHALWMQLRVESGATGRPDEVLAALGLDRQPRRIARLRLLWLEEMDSGSQ